MSLHLKIQEFLASVAEHRARVLAVAFFGLASGFMASNSTMNASTISVTIAETAEVLYVTSPNANKVYIKGESLRVHVVFSLPVYVDTTGGTPYINLDTGGSGTYITGSGTNTLVFDYLILPGHLTPDLNYITTTSLQENGADITINGSDAALTALPAPNNANALGQKKDIVIKNSRGGHPNWPPLGGGNGGSSGGDSGGSSGGETGGGDIPPEEESEPEAMPEESALPAASECPTTIGQDTYRDLPEGLWYEQAVENFLCKGYLDKEEIVFRAKHGAKRSEVAKLITLVHERAHSPVKKSLFRDIEEQQWYAEFVEAAANNGWMLGDDNCYGRPRCKFRPSAQVTRAEFGAVIVRSFRLNPTYARDPFLDVPEYAWYSKVMQTLGDHCIVMGDSATGLSRPNDPINRAEMVVMLERILRGAYCPYATKKEIQKQQQEHAELKKITPVPDVTIPSEEPLKQAAPAPVQPSLCRYCGRCGEGIWNVCDALECASLGDCIFREEFFGGACSTAPTCQE